MKIRVRWQLISWSENHSCWLLGRAPRGKVERVIMDATKPRTQEEKESRILRLLAITDKSKRTWGQARGVYESRNC